MKANLVFGSEKGSVLVVSMLVLSLLTMIGIAATTTSTIETQIATNDRIYKDTFYRAEGGLGVAQELLEQNFCCYPDGFTATEDDDSAKIEGTIMVLPNSLNFCNNPTITNQPPVSDNDHDAYITQNDGTRTNLKFGRDKTSLSIGSAIQMAAGYEGIGKGTAGAGASTIYDIYAQHLGKRNSETMLTVKWSHIVLPGAGGDCKY